MSFASLAERYGDFYAPVFELRVGEIANRFSTTETYTGDQGLISGLRVDTAIDRVNRFSFSLNDVFDRQQGEAGRFDPAIRSAFTVGTAVEIEMGYATGGTTTLLRGRINAVKPNFPAGGAPSLSVTGYDLLHGMQQGTGDGHWADTDLGTIIQDLVNGVGFADTRIETEGVSIIDRHHPETSDHAFLARLAREHDSEFFARAGSFHFRKTTTASTLAPTATLTYGQALRSFTPGSANPRAESTDARGDQPRVGTVKVRHHDEINKEAIVGTAEVPGGGDETRVETIPVRSEAEADQRAESIASEIARRGDTGPRGDGPSDEGTEARAETIGLPEIQIGRVVELTGLGEEYSGTYHVEAANHRIDDAGYTTTFDVRRPTNE